MNLLNIETLNERLRRLESAHNSLERQCRGWKRLVAGLLVGAVALGAAGAATQRSKVIEAEGFNLVGKDGKATAKLFNTPDGKPVLSFFNGDANVLNLGVAGEGVADMVFYDRAGKARIMFVLTEDNASLGFYDPTRKSGITLSSDEGGTSGVGLFFKDRKDRVLINTTPDGMGHVKVMDNAGKVVFQAP